MTVFPMISSLQNVTPMVLKIRLTNRLQQVEIGATFSSYLQILRNAPKTSIIRPILFNVFINDLMFFIKKREFCNFTDNATIHSYSLNYEEAHRKLSNDTCVVPKWFWINCMVANPGKFQIFLRSSINNNNMTFIVENKHIKSTNEVKLLGNIIDHKLTFTKHINSLCNTACKTFASFDKNKKFLSQDKQNSFLRLICNADIQILSSNTGVLW